NQAPFKLDCDGGTIYLSNTSGQLIVSQKYPEAMSRTAWARKTDGGDEWGWTASPTPGATNATSAFATQRLDAPVVSVGSRLFTGSLQVSVDIPDGATLMYTTDGSVPTPKQAPKQDDGTGDNEPIWTNWVKNSDCEGNDATCFVSKDGDNPDNMYRAITNGVGTKGSRGIKIHSVDNAENAWDTQFFVYTPDHVWQAGEKYRFRMSIRADKPARISVQTQKGPGEYIYWSILHGEYNITTDWMEIYYEGTITDKQVRTNGSGEICPLQTIAFQLNESKEENNYYFDDIVWESLEDYSITVRDNPGQESKTGKFTVSNTTNYVFRLFKDGYLPSVPVTRSYIKTDTKYTIPVISIVGDERYYYDNVWGIDVEGTNGIPGNGRDDAVNWNMPWDRPVNFSLISPTDGMLFNQDVMTSVSGGWSRQDYPRSFKLKSSKVFDGLNHLDYAFFPQKPYIRSKALLVRNGGNDGWSRFKDPAMTSIVQRSGIDVDVQSTLQVAEYINGEFRGILNLREPNNDKFIYANWGYDDEEIDYFENFQFTDGTDEAWNHLLELSEHINDNGVYDEIQTLLDIDEFTYYMAIELYLGNSDWPNNNVKGYRSQDDGRFRFILFDLDQIFNYWCAMTSISTLDTDFYDEPLVRLFRNLLSNDKYRKKFIDTFCMIGGSVFEGGRVAKMVKEIADAMRPMQQIEGRDPDGSANEIKDRMSYRFDEALAQLEEYEPAQIGGLQRQTVRLSADAPGAHITINDIDVPYAYFKGYLFRPVRLEAKAPANYRFAGWKTASGSITSTNPVIDLPTGSTVTLTATFTKLSDGELLAQGIATLRVNEVSAGNSIYVNEWFKHNDWFEIYNTTDTDLDAAGLYVSDDEDNPL
ncbi:MAG: CotH kinase family protein, partial [Prevotella sp.]|nr:CotH kinase family protein [Prevotella sp.]